MPRRSASASRKSALFVGAALGLVLGSSAYAAPNSNEVLQGLSGSNGRGISGSNVQGLSGSNGRGLSGSNGRGISGSNVQGLSGERSRSER